MQIALYADSPAEQQQITGDLKKCGLEYLRPVQVTLLSDYAEFCGALQRKRFDLLVIAMNGTFSLELMDAAARLASRTHVFWFSDLDFAVRSYDYGVIWFGKKPVMLNALRRAFQCLTARQSRNPLSR